MFESKSLAEHLARGVVGLVAFAAAVVWAPRQPWLAVALLPVGLVALRGCPSCWLLGLVQTIAPSGGKGETCTDGSCAERSSSKR
jgi:hypothetical protein